MSGKRPKQPAEKLKKPRPELAFDPIAAALRELHDSVAAEGIPDDFLQLLDKLDDAPTNRRPN